MTETATLRAAGRPIARPSQASGPLPPSIARDPGPPSLDLDFEALQRMGDAANDSALADFASEATPLLALDEKAGLPISPDQFYRDVIEDAVEILGAVARHRFEGPWSRKPEEEARILGVIDAILAAGEGSPGAILASWRQAVSSTDPWKTWAAAFALSSILGEPSLDMIAAGLAEVPPASLAHVALAAEAIALVPRPDAAALDAKLNIANPVCRAVRLDLRTRRGQVETATLAGALSDPEAPIVDAALRHLDRSPELFEPLAEKVRALLDHPHRAIAWRAARALTLRGDTRPFHAVLSGDPLASRLGPFALELFVLAGKMDDLRAMDRVLGVMKPTPAVLSAIARFGHPRVLSFLTFSLTDKALTEAAATALETLFGDIVPPQNRPHPEAWSRAVAARGIDPDARLRRGAPWSPAVVAAEIQTGTLNRTDLIARADELRCRAKIPSSLDLGAFGDEPTAALHNLVRAALSATEGAR